MKSQVTKPGQGSSPKGITFVLFAMAVLTAACAYGYSVYAESRRQEELLPRLRLSSLVRDARKYETLAGRLPRTFDEIEELVWKHQKRKPTFDMNGAAYTMGKYFYLYHALDERTATVWAVPVGPRRDEASSHFVVLGPEGMSHWKGAAIKLEDFKRLTVSPPVAELASLGLVRQPDEVDAKKRREQRRAKELKTPSTRATR